MSYDSSRHDLYNVFDARVVLVNRWQSGLL